MSIYSHVIGHFWLDKRVFSSIIVRIFLWDIFDKLKEYFLQRDKVSAPDTPHCSCPWATKKWWWECGLNRRQFRTTTKNANLIFKEAGRNINTLEMSKVISPTFKYSPHLIRFGVTLIIGLWHKPPLFDYHDDDDDDDNSAGDNNYVWSYLIFVTDTTDMSV